MSGGSRGVGSALPQQALLDMQGEGVVRRRCVCVCADVAPAATVKASGRTEKGGEGRSISLPCSSNVQLAEHSCQCCQRAPKLVGCDGVGVLPGVPTLLLLTMCWRLVAPCCRRNTLHRCTEKWLGNE